MVTCALTASRGALGGRYGGLTIKNVEADDKVERSRRRGRGGVEKRRPIKSPAMPLWGNTPFKGEEQEVL